MSKESLIVGMKKNLTIQGNSSHEQHVFGQVVRLTAEKVIVEFPGFEFLPHLSEVIDDIHIESHGTSPFARRGTVTSVANTGSSYLCEIKLEGVTDSILSKTFGDLDPDRLGQVMDRLICGWQAECRIQDNYRLAVHHIQSFLAGLRSWANGLEQALLIEQKEDQSCTETGVADTILKKITPILNSLFAQFELAAAKVEDDFVGTHSSYVKSQLHPFLLCSPFMWRIYRKPLGYAGDSEMVSMILRNPYEGPSLYARVLNKWILSQILAEAHRNRVSYLATRMLEEFAESFKSVGAFKVFNLGCGPAHEVKLFLRNVNGRKDVDLTLADFSDETLKATASVLANYRSSKNGSRRIRFIKCAAAQVVRSSGKELESSFNMVYCAGLFDYLADDISSLLLKSFHNMLAPGGVLLATNVQAPNPMHGTMTHIFDWHLECRNAGDMHRLWEMTGLTEVPFVSVEETGGNVFLEVKKNA